MRKLTLTRTARASLIFVTSLLIGSVCSAVSAKAQDRPKTQFLRFEEDWSVLESWNEQEKDDFFDPIKYVKLGDDAWASFGGQVQVRGERWDDFAFGIPADNDATFLLSRLSVHGDFHFGSPFRVFVEGKTALATDRDLPGGRRNVDVDTAALEQAFLDFKTDVGDSALTFRLGRQSFLFGKQRLVGPRPWANTRRRWDGVSVILDLEGAEVHAFFTQLVPVDKYDFNEPDEDQKFFGAYASFGVTETSNAEAYYLGIANGSRVVNDTVGKETRHTFGARVFGDVSDSRFDYEVESAWQFGRLGTEGVRACMFGSQFGFRPKSDLRVWTGVDYGSGDDEPGGGVQTFNQLYPSGHGHLGWIDMIARQNVLGLNVGATLNLTQDLTLSGVAHSFSRADNDDDLFDAGGGVTRDGSANDSRPIGSEIDLSLTYRADRHLTWLLVYGHFFPGAFLEDQDDIDVVYLQATYFF